MKFTWSLAMVSTVVTSIRFSRTCKLGIILGLSVFALGAVLTLSAVVFLAKFHPKLITTGPYSLSRHPFYLGLLTMLTGLVVYRGSYVGTIFLVFSIWFSIVRARHEEQELLRLHPWEYQQYMVKTPLLFKVPWWR